MGSVDLEWRLTKTLAPVLGPSNFIFTQETLAEKDEEPDSDFVTLTTKLQRKAMKNQHFRISYKN